MSVESSSSPSLAARQKITVKCYAADVDEAAGWTACDYTVVQNGTAARSDPKHNAKYHVRNQWAFWLVLRNGPGCHGPGRRLKHELTCEVCDKPFFARRADAKTYDGACRAKLYRRQRLHTGGIA